ncbi:MAG: hypothetical protein ABI432_11095 [Flavobacteriales bacterium]
MKHIRTRKATDWPEKEPITVRLWRAVLFFVPQDVAYDKKMHLVHEWWIEFDETGDPVREIGLDANGKPVLAAPDDKHIGFWLDTNMTLKDFDQNEVNPRSFEACWNQFFTGLRP